MPPVRRFVTGAERRSLALVGARGREHSHLPLTADLPGADTRAVSLARVLFTFRQLGVAPGRAEVVDEAPRVAHADVGRWFPVGEGRGATLQRRRCRTRPAVRVRPHGREQRRAA